jgi:colanic acid/amylovoran biosynthesis glycosyltransferase
MAREKSVALFSPRFVPTTQTFIYEESTRYQRYRAEVFTRFRMNADLFPFSPVHALAAETGPRHSLQSFAYHTTTLNLRFYRELSSGRFDLIHALFGRSAINALPYQRMCHLPLIVTFRGRDAAVLASPQRKAPVNWPYWILSKVLFKRASRYLTVSEDLAERLLRAGADPAKVMVWHSGVTIPPPTMRPLGSKTTILIVGRFVEKKGIEFGLEAFGQLARQRPGVTLRIVGDGPPRAKYEAIAAGTGVGNRILFLGMLSHADLRTELDRADILFAPSITPRDDVEGVPTVMMEANARNMPVVAARTGGLVDIVEDGRTGLLVSTRDVPGFVGALRHLVDNPAERQGMGLAAREKMVREHNIVDRIAVLESVYDDVIARYRAGQS